MIQSFSQSSYKSFSSENQDQNQSESLYSPTPNYFKDFNTNKKVETKMNNPNITFEQLFEDESQITDYILIEYTKFTEFLLKKPQIIKKMIQYMLFPDEMSDDFNTKSKYATISLQVLQSSRNELASYFLFENQSILHYIFSFLEEKNIEPSYTAYFSQIVEIFLDINLPNLWTYLVANNFILHNLVSHVNSKQISEIILKLLIEPMISDMFMTQKQLLIIKIIQIYHNLPQRTDFSDDSEEEENIAYILKGIFIEGRQEENKKVQQLSQFILKNEKLLPLLFKKVLQNQNNYSLNYSLSIINEIASIEQEYTLTTNLFTEYIKDFIEIFNWNLGKKQQKTSYGETIIQFGTGKLMLLRVIQNLLFWSEKQKIIDTIASLNIFKLIIHLCLDNKWNNMMHCVVMDIITNVMKSEHEGIIKSFLFSNIDVLNLIVENYRKKYLFTIFKNSQTKNEVKKGNVGFLTKLAKFLDDPDQPDIVYDHFQQSQKWQQFLKDKLVLISEIWESSLGEEENTIKPQAEKRWNSLKDSTGKISFLKRMSKIQIQEDIQQQQKRNSKFIMTDNTDPKEILLNMALNGCGRKGFCQNQYCLDNPENSRKSYTEADINKVIKEQILSHKLIVYPCQIYEIIHQNQEKEKLQNKPAHQRNISNHIMKEPENQQNNTNSNQNTETSKNINNNENQIEKQEKTKNKFTSFRDKSKSKSPTKKNYENQNSQQQTLQIQLNLKQNQNNDNQIKPQQQQIPNYISKTTNNNNDTKTCNYSYQPSFQLNYKKTYDNNSNEFYKNNENITSPKNSQNSVKYDQVLTPRIQKESQQQIPQIQLHENDYEGESLTTMGEENNNYSIKQHLKTPVKISQIDLSQNYSQNDSILNQNSNKLQRKNSGSSPRYKLFKKQSSEHNNINDKINKDTQIYKQETFNYEQNLLSKQQQNKNLQINNNTIQNNYQFNLVKQNSQENTKLDFKPFKFQNYSQDNSPVTNKKNYNFNSFCNNANIQLTNDINEDTVIQKNQVYASKPKKSSILENLQSDQPLISNNFQQFKQQQNQQLQNSNNSYQLYNQPQSIKPNSKNKTFDDNNNYKTQSFNNYQINSNNSQNSNNISNQKKNSFTQNNNQQQQLFQKNQNISYDSKQNLHQNIHQNNVYGNFLQNQKTNNTYQISSNNNYNNTTENSKINQHKVQLLPSNYTTNNNLQKNQNSQQQSQSYYVPKPQYQSDYYQQQQQLQQQLKLKQQSLSNNQIINKDNNRLLSPQFTIDQFSSNKNNFNFYNQKQNITYSQQSLNKSTNIYK